MEKSNRRAFLSATGRLAVVAGAAGVLVDCEIVPAIGIDSTKMEGLIKAHRLALAAYDHESAKLDVLEEQLPDDDILLWDANGNKAYASDESTIERTDCRREWKDRKIGELRATKATWSAANHRLGIPEQVRVMRAAESAEHGAFLALIACRPRTMDEVRQKIEYFASCRCFIDYREWNGVSTMDLFASLAPAGDA